MNSEVHKWVNDQNVEGWERTKGFQLQGIQTPANNPKGFPGKLLFSTRSICTSTTNRINSFPLCEITYRWKSISVVAIKHFPKSFLCDCALCCWSQAGAASQMGDTEMLSSDQISKLVLGSEHELRQKRQYKRATLSGIIAAQGNHMTLSMFPFQLAVA